MDADAFDRPCLAGTLTTPQLQPNEPECAVDLRPYCLGPRTSPRSRLTLPENAGSRATQQDGEVSEER